MNKTKYIEEKSPEKSVAIIGAGISGLALGYILSKYGFNVTIFEKDQTIGGLAQTFSQENVLIEKYYHHFFKSDHELLKLLDELGLESKIGWHNSTIGFLKNKKFYDFNTVKDLFALYFLTYWARFRFGLGYLLARIIPLKLISTNTTAEDFIIKIFGNEVYKKIWQPLLRGKFNFLHRSIAASWIWTRIQLRGKNSYIGEKLGYLDGSMKSLTDALAKEIKTFGGEIITGHKVAKIDRKFDKFFVNDIAYDLLISTTPNLVGKSPVKYLGAICVIITLQRRLTDYYWTTVLDENIPFKVIVEHTNFINPKECRDRHIIYLGEYLNPNSSRFKTEDQVLIDEYLDALATIFPNIKNDVLEIQITRSPTAQPVITNHYSQLKYETNIPGQYELTMAHIFPQDRGINYAIKEAQKLATVIQDSRDNNRLKN